MTEMTKINKFKSIEPIEIHFPRSNRKYFNDFLSHIGLDNDNYQVKGNGYKITNLIISDQVWVNPQELCIDKCSNGLIDCFEQIVNKKLNKIQSKLLLLDFIGDQF